MWANVWSSDKASITHTPTVVVTVLTNCPCFYHTFLQVLCHYSISQQGGSVVLNCSTSHCSVVFTLLHHMTSYNLARICFVYAGDMTYCNCYCSIQLTCLHQVLWIVWNQDHSWILLLFYFSQLCSGCSNFCKNGSARGLMTQNSMCSHVCH